jgi:hypothetical protein
MTIEMDVKINSSFYKKTNPNIWNKALLRALMESTKWAESECRKRAPVITGTLRDHHSFNVEDYTGEVKNNCGYASYVAFGTSRQAAQNYPLDIVTDMESQKLISTLHKKYLKKEGVVQ